MTSQHWEDPLPRKLFITVHRFAEMADIPHWKASEISHVLDVRYFGEKGGAKRISLRSAEEFIEMRDSGLPARAIFWERKSGGPSLIEGWGLTPRSASHAQTRAMRDGTWSAGQVQQPPERSKRGRKRKY